MNKNLVFLLLGTVFIPAGCNLAPRYDRPPAPIAAHWPSGPAYANLPPATTAPEAPDLPWQEFFRDEKLRQLIETALTNNRDLRSAALNVERARALYGIQRAERLPTLDATAGGNLQRLPADLSPTGRRTTVEQYNVNVGVFAWELDFFGRIRNLSARALEQYLATEQARRGAQILLISSVANTYLVLAADREGLALAQTTLENQQASYNLVKRGYDLGLAPELDLYRAQTQVDAARGDVVRFTQLAAQDENALNLLLGTTAPAELLPSRWSEVIPPAETSPGVPSDVLLRRPDVLQAESQLRAAHADIGAARATLFPRISLTGTVGTASRELSGLFDSGSGAWSFAPQGTMPIFDTRAWLALGVTKVQREIALTQYESAIQNAFREVADALAVRGTVDRQVAAQESLVHAVAETYRLSLSRYDKGIDSYLSVLDAQRSLYAAEQGLVSLRLARFANQVRLYAVLGGGGDVAPEEAEKPRSAQRERD
ncbi:MAG: efflux transporter outer membrane subunit [Planctomycetes bacterium]|jgi:multidrug efflux system outer membrane protein|nr:efflux transporter outer membrane subunit [Planctomycetota bacterium]